MKKSRQIWDIWATALILWTLAGCNGALKPMGLEDLESPEVATRIRAIKWAGQNNVTSAIPLLVDRLQEQDESVRFFAIVALERITGTDHGFQYRGDALQRAQAVERWRQALRQAPPDNDQ